jgi:hypothetical protein
MTLAIFWLLVLSIAAMLDRLAEPFSLIEEDTDDA